MQERKAPGAKAPTAAAGGVDEDGLPCEGQPDPNEEMAAAMMTLLARIITGSSPPASGRSSENPPLAQRHTTFVSFVISSGIIQMLHSLFGLFDCPSPDALHVAPHVEAGLALLHALTLEGYGNELSWPLPASAVTQPNAQALILALKESRLGGLPSLLTGMLLRASTNGTVTNARAAALPVNFVAVATTIISILANAALIDICAMQELLGAPDMRMEAYHLAFFLLSYVTAHWGDAEMRGLLDSTLLLLGLFCLGCPANQEVLKWGKASNIMALLCGLPFEYFAHPERRAVLLPTLLSACYANPSVCQVMQRELSADFLLQFLDGEEVNAADTIDDSTDGSKATDVPILQGGMAATRGRFALAKRFPRAIWDATRRQLEALSRGGGGCG
mmetsp:Transcript_18018/g.46982  ORF Transcript_18018/g.46982 Transcript_18018/m.46982 type:complete len:390 (+) Transcript_18018:1-1170(+)